MKLTREQIETLSQLFWEDTETIIKATEDIYRIADDSWMAEVSENLMDKRSRAVQEVVETAYQIEEVAKDLNPNQ